MANIEMFRRHQKSSSAAAPEVSLEKSLPKTEVRVSTTIAHRRTRSPAKRRSAESELLRQEMNQDAGVVEEEETVAATGCSGGGTWFDSLFSYFCGEEEKPAEVPSSRRGGSVAPSVLAVQQLIPHSKPNPKRSRRNSAPAKKRSSCDPVSLVSPTDGRLPRAEDFSTTAPRVVSHSRASSIAVRRSDSDGPIFSSRRELRRPDTPKLPPRMTGLFGAEQRRAMRNLTLQTSTKIEDVYDLGDNVGRGASGTVRRCVHRSTGEECAVKTVKRSRKSTATIDEDLRREINILANVHHPNIVDLFDAFDDPENDRVHMVMELCKGGELQERVREGLRESDAAVVAIQMLLAIEYLHSQKIVHRDLKPENFMFLSREKDGEPSGADDDLVLIDFGVSTFLHKVLDDAIGTIHYTAPEVFEKEYDERCDLWSIGVILYSLLAKKKPFDGKNDAMIYKAISRKQPKFDIPELSHVSQEAKTFLRSLLEKDYRKRPRATQALKDPWFQHTNVSTLAAYGDDILTRLARFKEMNDVKKVAHQLIAKNLTKAEIGFLQQQFRLLDIDGDGYVTVGELLTATSALRDHDDANSPPPAVPPSDADADQVVFDADEFIAATFRHHVKLREEHVEACYRKFDRRNKGYVVAEDLYDLFQTRERAHLVFDQVDTNEDGILSLEEFKKLIADDDDDEASKTARSVILSPRGGSGSSSSKEASATSPTKSPLADSNGASLSPRTTSKERSSARSRFARYATSKFNRKSVVAKN